MGWQRQDHGPSVQQALEEALGADDRRAAPFTAAGRTDAGVHALAMTAHVDVDRSPHAAPAAGGTERACAAATGFGPRRRGGRGRLARALLAASAGATSTASSTAGRRPRSTRARVAHCRCRSTSKRCSAAQHMLIGRHDFTTFRSVQCQSDSPVKTLDRLDVEPGRRGNPRRGGGAKLPAPPGTFDGRLPGAGRARPMATGRHAARRSKRATGQRLASTRRRTDFTSSKRLTPRRASRGRAGGFPSPAGLR